MYARYSEKLEIKFNSNEIRGCYQKYQIKTKTSKVCTYSWAT